MELKRKWLDMNRYYYYDGISSILVEDKGHNIVHIRYSNDIENNLGQDEEMWIEKKDIKYLIQLLKKLT
jgi:hypothetical protein